MLRCRRILKLSPTQQEMWKRTIVSCSLFTTVVYRAHFSAARTKCVLLLLHLKECWKRASCVTPCLSQMWWVVIEENGHDVEWKLGCVKGTMSVRVQGEAGCSNTRFASTGRPGSESANQGSAVAFFGSMDRMLSASSYSLRTEMKLMARGSMPYMSHLYALNGTVHPKTLILLQTLTFVYLQYITHSKFTSTAAFQPSPERDFPHLFCTNHHSSSKHSLTLECMTQKHCTNI